MTYTRILELVDGRFHFACTTFREADITRFVASDLMSDVLTQDAENFMLITSLTSDQVVRTADIVGARAILLVNAKKPQERMRDLAEEFNISLLGSPLPMFRVCHLLAAGLEDEGREP